MAVIISAVREGSRRSNDWQIGYRNKVLIPNLYEVAFPKRYKLMEDGHVDPFMARYYQFKKHIDTMVCDAAAYPLTMATAIDELLQIKLDEKIVRPPQREYLERHDGYTLEVVSCCKTGYWTIGWMLDSECDILVWCFATTRGYCIVHFIPFLRLRDFLFKNYEKFEVTEAGSNGNPDVRCYKVPSELVFKNVLGCYEVIVQENSPVSDSVALKLNGHLSIIGPTLLREAQERFFDRYSLMSVWEKMRLHLESKKPF